MKALSLQAKITGVLLGFIILFSAASFYLMINLGSARDAFLQLNQSIDTMDKVSRESTRLSKLALPLYDQVGFMSEELSQIQKIFLASMEDEDTEMLEDILPHKDHFIAHFQKATELFPPSDREELESILIHFERYLSLGEKIIVAVIDGGDLSKLTELSEHSTSLRLSMNKLRDEKKDQLGNSIQEVSSLHADFREKSQGLSSHVEERFNELKSLVSIFSLGSLLLGVLLSLRLGKNIARPIEELSSMANKMSGGDLSQRITVVSDEAIGKLGNSFNEMAASIEKSQEELREWNRTLEHKVLEKTASIQSLLDNAGQGFLSFDRFFRVQKEFSRECSKIFHQQDISGLKVEKIFFTKPEDQKEFLGWMSHAFEKKTPFGVICDLAPEKLYLKDRTFQIEYKKLDRSEGTYVMCILTDITSKLELERQVLREQSLAKRILRVLQFREQFLVVYRELNHLLGSAYQFHQSSPNLKDYKEHRRIVHTLKGTAGLFDFLELMDCMNEYEEYLQMNLEQSQIPDPETSIQLIDRVVEEFDAILRFLQDNLAEIVDWEELTIRIPETEFRRLLQFVKKTEISLHDEMLVYLRRPFRNFFEPFQTLVNELAMSLDKVLHPLQIRGGKFLVDPDLYRESIRPLVHVFRNSVDHGIEAPVEREMNGKDPMGMISVELKQDSDWIHIRIQDDGSGIDPDLISELLEKNGLKSKTEISQMSESELVNSVFLSGFSTRESASLVSGQGIGMDAVKSKIEELKGKVSLETKIGEGTCIHIDLPNKDSYTFSNLEAQNKKENMLIIDHDPISLRLVSAFIEQSEKFEVQRCTSYEQALQWMSESSVEVVVLDQETSLGDWKTFIEAARVKNPLVQIIMLTREYSHDLFVRASNMGIIDIFTRPAAPYKILKAAEGSRDRLLRWQGEIES